MVRSTKVAKLGRAKSGCGKGLLSMADRGNRKGSVGGKRKKV